MMSDQEIEKLIKDIDACNNLQKNETTISTDLQPTDKQ